MLRDRRTRTELRHDHVATVRIDYLLHLRQFVSGKDEEAVRPRPDSFVLGHGQRKRLLTVVARALADEPHLLLGSRKLLNPFVHLAEQALVLRRTLTLNVKVYRLRHLAAPHDGRDQALPGKRPRALR